MSVNSGKDPDDLWGEEKEDSVWDLPEDSYKQTESKAINFHFNPKIMGIFIGAIALLIVIANVVPKLFDNKNNKVSQVANSASSTPSASPSNENSGSTNVDLYTQPKSLQSFIDNGLASVVTIFCDPYSGSGWAIDLSDDASSSVDDKYPTEIITNNHVIEGCETSGVYFKMSDSEATYPAYVYSYDRSNDLAILITSKYLPPLPTVTSENKPRVGNWVMAIGSPGAGNTTLEGSVTTGHITNFKDGFVITDTTINPGNSGGPLLNSAGQVIAVVTKKIVDAKINNIGFAQDVARLCDMLNNCTKKQILK